VTTVFPVEEILDHHRLYRRIYFRFIHNGRPEPSAFQNATPESETEVPGMSVLWERHAHPRDCLLLEGADPNRDGVAVLIAGEVRTVEGQTVVHTPEPDLQAHSDVFGDKPTRVRRSLRNKAKMIVLGPQDLPD
jgi:hypothetical protein